MKSLGRSTSVLAGMVAFLAAGVSGAAGPEQRCTELGSHCMCSEPFNNNDFPNWTQGGLWDPSDSPNSSECGFGDPNDGNMEVGTASTAPGSTAELPVNYFLRTFNSIAALYPGDNVCNTNPQRACVRFYRRWGPTFPKVYDNTSISQCDESKIFDATTDGPVSGIQWNTQDDQFHLRHITSRGDRDVHWNGTKMSPSSCQNQWCRFEICISGNFCTSGSETLWAQVTALETGETMTFGADTQQTAGKSWNRPFINLWTSGNACRDNQNGDWQGISHMMYAGWGTDNGQKIGPAYEIEGAGAGSGGSSQQPPAEPEARPPAAPILLGD